MWLNSRFVVAHPDERIPVPKHAYDHFLDYEVRAFDVQSLACLLLT